MMTAERARVLVAGVGNIFLCDDAFGVEAVGRLARRPLPDGVRVVDFGIRGLDLAYALLDGYEAVVLVDATPRGGAPGTLYLVEPELGGPLTAAEETPLIETHNMDPARVIRLAVTLGGPIPRLFLVGCEPGAPDGGEDFPAGMSDPVRAAVDGAVAMIESLVGRLLAGGEGGERTIPGKEV